ncbi:Bug family tripartite tricarboxylate transporter substrate binding protein [Pigmentiphaga litoralis]|uniref:Bug family tripartite tricarboxylate transporter substrate binding protein n=1 Tax=Pigmentiphaga litoralis TaxID=516702 RepID=UPI003B4337D5
MPARPIWIASLAAAALLAVLPPAASADADTAAYPTKPIRLVFPWTSGGSLSDLARSLGDGVSQRLGQPVVVDYKPGASSTIAAALVARSAPDGYTLLIGGNPTYAINQFTHRKLSYDPAIDLAPVALVATAPFFVMTGPSLPVSNLNELLAHARAHPGKLSYGTPGVGSVPHLSVVRFAEQAGLDLVHVPYNGQAQFMTDLIGGHIDLVFSSAGFPYIQSGKVKGLAVTGAQRVPGAPDIPTVAEAGVKGFSAEVWWGIAAPRGTPAAIVDKINHAINGVIGEAAFQQRFAEAGYRFETGTPAQFASRIQGEIPVWRNVVARANLTGGE